MVNGQGEVTDRWAGYDGVEGFIEQVDKARADMSTIEEKKERFKAEPTLALALALGQYSEAVFESDMAVDYYRKSIALDPSLSGEMRTKIFMSMYYGLRTGTFTPAQLLAEGEAILADPHADQGAVLMVTSVTRQMGDAEVYRPFLERALELTEGNEDADVLEFRKELLVDQALIIEQDKPKALELKRAAMSDGWQEDPGGLNNFAWWCFENDINLEEAMELAIKGADLSPDDATRANILDTAAEIAFALGKVDKAVELETEAVKLAPERDAFKANLERFKTTQG